jgi:hypothetical protein
VTIHTVVTSVKILIEKNDHFLCDPVEQNYLVGIPASIALIRHFQIPGAGYISHLKAAMVYLLNKKEIEVGSGSLSGL